MSSLKREREDKHEGVLGRFHKLAKTDLVIEETPVEAPASAPLASLQPHSERVPFFKAAAPSLDRLGETTRFQDQQTATFSSLGVAPLLCNNLEALGARDAFPVQVAVLQTLMPELARTAPDALRDTLVAAATGSGKTLAYCVPIVQTLAARVVPRLRAVVLVPTKPLVTQVRATLEALSKGTPLVSLALRSDASFLTEAARLAQSVPDIVVCTPGRLVDHLAHGLLLLAHLRFLVLDEADRLLLQLFQEWTQVVASHMPAPPPCVCPPVKLVFLATLALDAGKWAALSLHRPRVLNVGGAERLFSVPLLLHEHTASLSLASQKPFRPLLLQQVLQHVGGRALVFAASNEDALRLARVLQLLDPDSSVAAVTGSMGIGERRKLLAQFEEGELRVLVATDLVARGLDLPLLTCVVNYSLPNSAREYVHRVGRTARAGRSGDAYTLVVGSGEAKWWRELAQAVERSTEVADHPLARVDPSDADRLQEVLSRVEREVYGG